MTLDLVFEALSSTVRRKILAYLSATELTAGEIAERFSISNMSTEWGPLVGWFPVDAVTIAYLKNVHQRLKAIGIERFTEFDIHNWQKNPPQPDADADRRQRPVLQGSQRRRAADLPDVAAGTA